MRKEHAAHSDELKAATMSEYQRLVSKAILCSDDNLQKAEATLRKAMLMEPNQPQAYGALGVLHSRRGNVAASAQAYLKGRKSGFGGLARMG
jgi:Flp pilus assembly protein TadD